MIYDIYVYRHATFQLPIEKRHAETVVLLEYKREQRDDVVVVVVVSV
jgi:hypothetical protein